MYYLPVIQFTLEYKNTELQQDNTIRNPSATVVHRVDVSHHLCVLIRGANKAARGHLGSVYLLRLYGDEGGSVVASSLPVEKQAMPKTNQADLQATLVRYISSNILCRCDFFFFLM